MARTIHEQFDKLFPSYCGGSPAAKPEGVDKWCSEHLDELPTMAEVERGFAEWVETFADRPSDAEGVKPLSPRQRFETTRIAKRTLPEHVLNVLLLKLTPPRRVTAKGVLHNGIPYTDDGGHLFKYQGDKVRIRVAPDNVARAWVCDLKGKPLFIARQNLVKGTADDIRTAMNNRKQAKRMEDRDANEVERSIQAQERTQMASLKLPESGPIPEDVKVKVCERVSAVREARKVSLRSLAKQLGGTTHESIISQVLRRQYECHLFETSEHAQQPDVLLAVTCRSLSSRGVRKPVGDDGCHRDKAPGIASALDSG